MRALWVTLGCLLLAATPARAKELSQTVRDMAERAWLEGRLDDLDTILAGATEPVDRFPLALRDRWWRGPSGISSIAGSTFELPDDPTLIERRYFWLDPIRGGDVFDGARGPYPLARGGGEEDPWPVITALVLDRMLREGHGHHGLPEHGPLEKLGASLDPKSHERAIYFLTTWTRHLMRSTYHLPEDDDVIRREKAEAARLSTRNARWAWILLAVFVLVPAVIGWRLGRNRLRES